LPLAFARSIDKVYLQESVAQIDVRRKLVTMDSGRVETWDYLVSTLPLPVLFRMTTDTPDKMRHAAEKLRAVSVLNINIGVDRPGISDQHWIYFPEDRFIFSRVGFPMNFSSAVAPAGTSSAYIEITYPEGRKPDLEHAYRQSIAGLECCGILKTGDRILTCNVIDIKYAYVVFDRHRQAHLQELTDYLETRNIFTAGRYGRWDYYSMEDSILSGKAAADRILKVSQPLLA
jgi:UDP-galactopyranose mutase